MAEVIGAEVLRPMEHAGKRWRPGDRMTAAEWASVDERARRYLGSNRMARELHGDAPPDGPLVRVYVPAGQGRFNVVEGRCITPEPVSREEAMALTRHGAQAA
jgi:hypothetical protein